jgi:hypothetical protein
MAPDKLDTRSSGWRWRVQAAETARITLIADLLIAPVETHPLGCESGQRQRWRVRPIRSVSEPVACDMAGPILALIVSRFVRLSISKASVVSRLSMSGPHDLQVRGLDLRLGEGSAACSPCVAVSLDSRQAVLVDEGPSSPFLCRDPPRFTDDPIRHGRELDRAWGSRDSR